MYAEWSASSAFALKVIRPNRMVAGSATSTHAARGRHGWKGPVYSHRLEITLSRT